MATRRNLWYLADRASMSSGFFSFFIYLKGNWANINILVSSLTQRYYLFFSIQIGFYAVNFQTGNKSALLSQKKINYGFQSLSISDIKRLIESTGC